jgi:Glu-tRNA(Gln) amidotransferase subunit E-like FAD-binding protein
VREEARAGEAAQAAVEQVVEALEEVEVAAVAKEEGVVVLAAEEVEEMVLGGD